MSPEHGALILLPVGGVGQELEVGLSVHDASRLEWVVEAALPAGDTPMEVSLSAEIPANAWTAHDPFERLQLLPRLSLGSEPTGPRFPGTVDEVRRAALAAAQHLKRARAAIARDLTSAAPPSSTVRRSLHEEVLVAVGAALERLESVRTEITSGGAGEPPALVRERDLAAEFLSHQALDLLSAVQAAVDVTLAPRASAEATTRELRRGLAAALARELHFRRSRGLLLPDGEDARALERYVERASLLKKHFQELYFLSPEHELTAMRARNWSGVAAAMVAALWAFPLGLLLTQGSIATFSVGFAWVVLLFAAMYAVKDRIKEAFRLWLTSRVARGLGSRLTTLRTSHGATRVLRLREWFRSSREHRPDPLNPDAGAARPVVVLRYEGRGALQAVEGVDATHVRLVFRLDLTPLFSRLDDPVRRVAVLAQDGGALRFARAPRAYRIPVEMRVRCGESERTLHRVLVAHKLGLDRLEA